MYVFTFAAGIKLGTCNNWKVKCADSSGISFPSRRRRKQYYTLRMYRGTRHRNDTRATTTIIIIIYTSYVRPTGRAKQILYKTMMPPGAVKIKILGLTRASKKRFKFLAWTFSTAPRRCAHSPRGAIYAFARTRCRRVRKITNVDGKLSSAACFCRAPTTDA